TPFIHPTTPSLAGKLSFVRDDTLQPRFTGPHQVLLTTQTAVFLEGPALVTTEDTAFDQWTSLPLSDIKLKLTRKK
uniref:Uncharacterized protein n=1 Tax=Gopherus evgoodei TaxID=1825980 RepID=A0A8C4VW77_9SAUR